MFVGREKLRCLCLESNLKVTKYSEHAKKYVNINTAVILIVN
jgi:hypothetical protein